MILAVVLAGSAFVLFRSSRGPVAVAEEFMHALDTKDVDRLVALSHFESPPPDLREQWDNCVNVGARNFVYLWRIEDVGRPIGGRVSVKFVFAEFRSPKGEELPELFELPLIDTAEGWKVNMDAIPRRFFPYLPR